MRAAAVVMALVLLGFIHSPSPSHAQYTVIQITDNGRKNMHPRVNDHGFVVWSASDGTDQEIYMYNGQSVVQLTDNALCEVDGTLFNSLTFSMKNQTTAFAISHSRQLYPLNSPKQIQHERYSLISCPINGRSIQSSTTQIGFSV